MDLHSLDLIYQLDIYFSIIFNTMAIDIQSLPKCLPGGICEAPTNPLVVIVITAMEETQYEVVLALGVASALEVR